MQTYYTYDPFWKKKRAAKNLLRRFLPFGLLALFVGSLFVMQPQSRLLMQLIVPFDWISPRTLEKNQQHEVFGFAPYWNMRTLKNTDFTVLTTFAYFGVDVDSEGNLDTKGQGYKTFVSKTATDLFQEAHNSGTRVVLTLTQMDNDTIKTFLDNEAAQKKLIADSTRLVRMRGIDGVNVDFEYVGDPGPSYRRKFSLFIKRFSEEMHQDIAGSHFTISVYASAVKDPKLYDIASLARDADALFMMAYDFATTGSKNVMPTAPLYGYEDGKYWYDIASAVDDFLTQMPANKLIVGLPWYGYNYPVVTPGEKTPVHEGYYTYYRWRGRQYSEYHALEAHAQTYASVKEDLSEESSGWDDIAKVGWKAYIDADGVWRMIYIDDAHSLGIKYDFIKEKNLLGTGIWAMGFDGNESDLWKVLKDKFGEKLVDSRVQRVMINELF